MQEAARHMQDVRMPASARVCCYIRIWSSYTHLLGARHRSRCTATAYLVYVQFLQKIKMEDGEHLFYASMCCKEPFLCVVNKLYLAGINGLDNGFHGQWASAEVKCCWLHRKHDSMEEVVLCDLPESTIHCISSSSSSSGSILQQQPRV